MINGGASPNKFLGAKNSLHPETAKQSQICQIYEAFELHGGRQSIGSGTKLLSPSVDGSETRRSPVEVGTSVGLLPVINEVISLVNG